MNNHWTARVSDKVCLGGGLKQQSLMKKIGGVEIGDGDKCCLHERKWVLFHQGHTTVHWGARLVCVVLLIAPQQRSCGDDKRQAFFFFFFFFFVFWKKKKKFI